MLTLIIGVSIAIVTGGWLWCGHQKFSNQPNPLDGVSIPIGKKE